MSLIIFDSDIINLSSSPNYSIHLYSTNNYKLYENRENNNILEIYGSFFVVNSNIKKSSNVQTFFNLESLFIKINDNSVNINIDSLEYENIHGSIDNYIYNTNVKNIGETIQKEFFITNIKNISIKIIKNMNSHQNLVEISTITKFSMDHMNILNNELEYIFEKHLEDFCEKQITKSKQITRSKPILIPKSNNQITF